MSEFDQPATLQLWEACQRGDINTVTHLIASQSSRSQYLKLHYDWESDWEGTCLSVAASQGFSEIVKALLCAGALPQAQIKPATSKAKRAAALEQAGYQISKAAQRRRHCEALIRNITKSPPLPVPTINFGDPTTVLCRSTHELYALLGQCEYQMKQSFVGSNIETPSLRRGQKFVGCQEKQHHLELLGGMHALKQYRYRVRYHSNGNASWHTDWSEWSEFITMPDESLLLELIYVDSVAGTNFNFTQRLNEFCKAGVNTSDELIRQAQKETLDRSLLKIGTALDYNERRTLIRVLRAKFKDMEYVDYNHTIRYGKEPIRPLNELPSTAMFRFLEQLGDGMEQYTELMFRMVDSLSQLLTCYGSKEEFLEDVREVLPAMKPAHRRIIWLGIKKQTNQNATTQACMSTSTGTGEEKERRK